MPNLLFVTAASEADARAARVGAQFRFLSRYNSIFDEAVETKYLIPALV